MKFIIRLYLLYGHGYSKAQFKLPIGTKDVSRRGELKAMSPPQKYCLLPSLGVYTLFFFPKDYKKLMYKMYFIMVYLSEIMPSRRSTKGVKCEEGCV